MSITYAVTPLPVAVYVYAPSTGSALVDPVEAPGRRRLRLGQTHHRVLLDVGDAPGIAW
jgi:hypothetical protein